MEHRSATMPLILPCNLTGRYKAIKNTFFHSFCLHFHAEYSTIPFGRIIMATLQVRDIDSRLYNALRAKAKADHRSVSQEVVYILEDHLSKTSIDSKSQSQLFLGLTNAWTGPESAADIIKIIKNSNINSERFSNKHVTFD
jgi:hypothetical protein